MYLVADRIADWDGGLCHRLDIAGTDLVGAAIGVAAVPEGIALIDLPGQVETDIDTLASSFLPALSGAARPGCRRGSSPWRPFPSAGRW